MDGGDVKEKASLPATYFDDIYERSADPWNFETSAYEAAKYQATLDSLPCARYERALEVGCSIGVLTELLATRCGSLLSVDVSSKALDRARERCSYLPQVRFEFMAIPQSMPAEDFDLVVISEVAYYWQRADLERAMTLLALHHRQGGHLVLVHFTPPVADYPLTGDEVHTLWLARSDWKLLHESRHDTYRLSVLERR